MKILIKYMVSNNALVCIWYKIIFFVVFYISFVKSFSFVASEFTATFMEVYA